MAFLLNFEKTCFCSNFFCPTRDKPKKLQIFGKNVGSNHFFFRGDPNEYFCSFDCAHSCHGKHLSDEYYNPSLEEKTVMNSNLSAMKQLQALALSRISNFRIFLLCLRESNFRTAKQESCLDCPPTGSKAEDMFPLGDILWVKKKLIPTPILKMIFSYLESLE